VPQGKSSPPRLNAHKIAEIEKTERNEVAGGC